MRDENIYHIVILGYKKYYTVIEGSDAIIYSISCINFVR
jgi:hypothetical protein